MTFQQVALDAGPHSISVATTTERTPLIPHIVQNPTHVIPRETLSSDPNSPYNSSSDNGTALSYNTTPPSRSRFTTSQKRGILALVSFASFSSLFTSNAFIPTIREVSIDMGTDSDIIALSISIYLLFNAIGSLTWARYADFYGKKPIYILTLPIYIIACILTSLSRTVPQLFIARALQAIGVCSFASMGGGTIADVYRVEERGGAMGIYSAATVLAPSTAPLIGGIIAQHTSWRTLQASLSILGVICLVWTWVLLPETSPPGSRGVDRYKCKSVDVAVVEGARGKRWGVRRFGLRVGFLNPLRSLSVMRDWRFCMTCYYMSALLITQSSLILPIPYILEKYYGITDESIIGAVCMASGIGNMVGAPLVGYISDSTIRRYKKKRGGRYVPEDRLRAAIIGAVVLVPLPMVVYGVAVVYVGGIAGLWVLLGCLFVNGIGVDMMFGPGVTYIADRLHENRIQGLAANSALRVLAISALSSCILPLTKAIGVFGSQCIVALVAWTGCGALFALIYLGERWSM